jgi:ElaB/YqjD/DUF883 family membrane-anchored ribosome-binding protein
MKENLLKKTEEEIASLGRNAARAKAAVADVVEDAVTNARRTAKRGYHKAEDLVDDAALGVKRHPFASVAVSFGTGAVAGWLISRRFNGRAASG